MLERLHRWSVIAVRIFLGLIFFTSGMGKLTHGDFVGLIGPVWLEPRLAEYGLAFWARFVAWSQVIIGLLLLSHRFATIGAVMLVPMLANIFIVTISLRWRGTPYVNAVLLLMNLYILLPEWPKLRVLLAREPGRRADVLAVAGLVAGLLAPALYGVDRMVTFVLAAVSILLFVAAALQQRLRTRS